MNEAARYVKHGWALCKIPVGKKGPNTIGWNLEENATTEVAEIKGWTGNVGLLHTWSRTCAIDIDDYAGAKAWLADFGIDLDQLLCADDAVQVHSGRENRSKLLYRLPDRTKAEKFRTVQVKDTAARVLLEFRCAAAGGVSVQDVLPPSIHPETGKPYAWGGTGSWKELPELPAALRAVWRDLRTTEKADRTKRPTGPGTGAEMAAFVERLAAADLKPFKAGKSVRSYCPHHGGESGTTLKVDEGSDGKVLAHCHAGCTFDQIIGGLGNPDLTPAPNDIASTKADALPPFSQDLLYLPHGLGAMQEWILGQMKYPSRATAGIGALALLSHVAMGHLTIDSYRGLGFNEQWVVLAPTGFGKEDLREPFVIVDEYLRELPSNQNLRKFALPSLQYNAPASLQGLHKLLEDNPAQVFIADEFAEWLGHAASDSHKQQALGYFMQAYTKATGTVTAPHSVSGDYKAVKNPRVLVFATSTAERMLEVMTSSQAESGALNRMVIHVAEQERIEKRYEGMSYTMPDEVGETLAWIYRQAPGAVQFNASAEAWELFKQHDSAVMEPLAHHDAVLAARLSEQAIKIAGLIALSDGRMAIDVRDLIAAFAIREGIYHRAAALIGNDGAISGMHVTGKALAQIEARLRKQPHIYISQIKNVSRQWGKLHVGEQKQVLAMLLSQGVAHLDGSKLVSNVYDD